MRIWPYILFSVVFFLLVYSCINNHKTLSAKDSSESMESMAANIAGMYTGQLPCVDCESISTTLELKKNNTYILEYMYEGKSDDLFVKEGDWSITGNKLNLKGLDYKYRVEADKLIQLDLSGNEIKGDLAEQYVLGREK